MPKKKTATKTSARAETGSLNVKLSKKTKKDAEKVVKNTSLKVLLFGLVFLIVGLCVGGGAFWIVCRDDCFEIVGNDQIELTLDETYQDAGVKIVAFGKSVGEEDIVIETNLKTDLDGNYYSDEIGTFYIKYSTTNIKYGKLFKVQKVRLVTFVEPSEGGD